MGVIKGNKINVLPKFVAKEVPAEEAAAAVPAASATTVPTAEGAPEETQMATEDAPAEVASGEAAAS
jgi:hypothetical protein